ncbi:hypothetical protein [Streptomyces sp. MP131-18]|uniref:hypothetical protein n=1 Tax=Streptomyces sp. MP131-18 TaxID=1857892 RepID=UPI00097C0255|nr:hypothetical protein [Streptomyces sp. MP131-18]ONK16062.1 hypothetical protein STBA_69120 [Streptomyces sp. MP131-18]
MSIASASAQFRETIETIKSAHEYEIRAASGAWFTLANAGVAESTVLASTAQEAAAEPGVGLRELSERLVQMTDFTSGTAALAQQISTQLQQAGDHTARAVAEALVLESQFDELMQQRQSLSTSAHAEQAMEGAIMALTARAQAVLTALDQEYANVIAGEAPTAPRSTGPGGPGAAPAAAGAGAPGGAAGAAGSAPADAAGAPGAAAGPAGAAEAPVADHQAPNGSAVGSGEYPHSSVMGPEQGDFAGWQRDPGTGYLVDPATGREFDPATGRWIDPVTGKPFGEATEYAARLSGLGTGSGGLASPGGLALVAPPGVAGGGSGGLAGLYGGVLPPSIAHAGPAGGQVLSQAMRNMDRNAHVATQMAMRESAQGGRPFMPPPAMAGGAAGGGQGRGGRGAGNGRLTDLTEDPEVWAPRRSATTGVLGE